MNALNEPKTQKKIKQIQIKGLRSLDDITLDLDGLTTLIGSNGSGKSSIVEACELIRRLSTPQFIDEFYKIHGGFSQLLRHDRDALTLKVHGTYEHGERPFRGSGLQSFSYELTLHPSNTSQPMIVETFHRSSEFLSEGALFIGSILTNRHANTLTYQEKVEEYNPVATEEPANVEEISWEASISPTQLLLHARPPEDTHHSGFSAATQSCVEVLAQIDVHIPFDVTARWVRKAFRKPSELRETTDLTPTSSLAISGSNLINAYHALKNDFSSIHWQKTMDYIRLGLGNDIDSINTRIGSSGDMGLSLKYHNFDKQVPASALSDGELAYLAFVALFRLNHNKSLLVFDEPDLHLHPKLMMRVLDFFETMAADGMQVLLTTHSDRLLDGLRDPASSVVLCQLNEKRATELFRPDRKALEDWLTDYRGFGAIRSDGHEASVMTEKIAPAHIAQ